MAEFKATAYVRLSYTDDKTVESDSIANQKKLIEEFAAHNPDIEIVNVRVDDGYSGILFDRPAFKTMMRDIEDGTVNCVIVKDLSRLGREFIETGRYLRKVFPAYGVRFIAVNDNVDTAKESVAGDLSVSFKSIINDEYCRDISVKVRSALDAKRRNGDYIGACTVYGYKKSEENKNKLVIDEYAAHIVEDIFQMRIEGMSAVKIAETLNNLGVLSPIEYKKNNGLPHPKGGYADVVNAKWSATTIIRILKDRVYTGTLIQGKKGKPNYKVKECVDKAENEWFVTENAHAPIISKNEFEAVQRVMKLDTRISPCKDNVYMFSGILICGCCGNRMTRKTINYKGKKYFYYYCSTGKKNGCTADNMVKEKDLIECVSESIKAHIRNVASLDVLIDKISRRNINHELIKRHTEKIAGLQEQLNKCHIFKANLYENYVNGILDKDEYKNLKRHYTDNEAQYEASIEELQAEIDNCLENKTERLKWIEYFKKFENIKSIDRKTVIELISSIVIFDKQSLQINFNYSEEYESALTILNEMKEAM